MSVEANKEIVREAYDAINRQDGAAFDALCSPELAANLRAAMQWSHATFANLHIEVTEPEPVSYK